MGYAAKPASAGCRVCATRASGGPRFGQPAQAGFVADQREALQARFQPPAPLEPCPQYFAKPHQPPALPYWQVTSAHVANACPDSSVHLSREYHSAFIQPSNTFIPICLPPYGLPGFILFHAAICAHDAPIRYHYHPSDITYSGTVPPERRSVFARATGSRRTQRHISYICAIHQGTRNHGMR